MDRHKMTDQEIAVEKKAETITATISPGAQVNDNHIYFYDDVTTYRVMQLNQQLRDLDHRLRVERVQRDMDSYPEMPIILHINSYGGEVFAGLSAYDQIKAVKTPVHTIIEGTACSSATLLSVAGKRRFITANAYMLIHQFSSFTWGTYEHFKDDMKLQDDLIDRMRKLYVDNSKLKYEQVAKLLKHDSWFNAEQAKKKGLVDEVQP